MDNRADEQELKGFDEEGIPQSRIDQDQLEKPGAVDQMYNGWLGQLFGKNIEEKRASVE